MKKIAIVLTVLLTFGMLYGCGKTDNALDKDEELVVGMELAYPPFEMTDEDGNPSGISVDLAYDLGKYLGREVRIENMSYNGLIPALTTDKIDLIISSMTITDKRKESIDFSDPYAKISLALLINKNSPVEDIDDLNVKGRKVAVKKGTTGHIYATDNLKNADIQVYDKESACVLAVVQGKADAFIYDQMTILKNWKQYPDSTKANLKPFQENPEAWGIGIKKGNEELLKKINEFIKEYKQNGGFDKLGEKYLKEQKKTFEDLGIPFFF